jgi:iron complex transport system permease protein
VAELPVRRYNATSRRSGLAATLGASARTRLVFALLIATALAAILLSLGLGQIAISPAQVAAILLHHAGLGPATSFDTVQDGVLWSLRLPRVLLGALAGCCLGLAGATLQGLLRSPLADPGVLGCSAGAALGTVIMLAIAGAGVSVAAMLPAAAAGSLLATACVYLLSIQDGQPDVLTMILAGVAMNAIAAGVVGLLIAATNNAALNSVAFWELGSLSGATWEAVKVTAPVAVVGALFLSRWARVLDLLATSDTDAHYLGVHVARSRVILLATTALLTAGAVTTLGIVAFVGLIVPHLMRLLLGPSHSFVLPASALGGAILVVVVDLLARTLAAPAELPLGSLTALVGCPYFIWLLRHAGTLRGRPI